MQRVGMAALLALCAACLLPTGCRRQQARPSAVAPPPASAAIQQILERSLAASPSPGAVVLVRTPRMSWVGSAGLADVAHRRPMRPTDALRIGSITKVFVAVAALKLSEEGKLRLNNRVSAYVSPSLLSHIANGRQVTIRNLLTMASGIPDYIDLPAYRKPVDDGTHPAPWRPAEILRTVYGLPAVFPPGDDQVYSNTNYLLLQMAIEEAAGRPLAAEIRRAVLQPAGLRSTYMEVAEPRPGGFHGLEVRGYEEGADVTEKNEALGLADGGLVSTAEDLARFLDTLLKQKSLLSPESLREMLAMNPIYDYGMGLDNGTTAWGDAIGHSGGQSGFGCDMRYVPDQQAFFVMLTNDVNTHLFDAIFEPMMKQVLPAPPIAPGYQVVAHWGSESQLAGPGGIALDQSGNVFVLDPDNCRVLKFTGEGRLLTQWGSDGPGRLSAPLGLAVDRHGKVWVADEDDNCVQEFTGDGKPLARWDGGGRLEGPTAVGVDARGCVTVAERRARRLQRLSPDGRLVEGWAAGLKLAGPTAIAAGPDGSVVVSDVRRGSNALPTEARILKLGPDGRLLTRWGSLGAGEGQLRWPTGIAVAGDGSVYVSDGGTHTISRFSPAGLFQARWRGVDIGEGWFGYPQGAAVDAQGDLFVADSVRHRVERIRVPVHR